MRLEIPIEFDLRTNARFIRLGFKSYSRFNRIHREESLYLFFIRQIPNPPLRGRRAPTPRKERRRKDEGVSRKDSTRRRK